MKAIKRIQLLLQYKLSPAGPPKPDKAYCRYPGCGRLFLPVDALEEFCSSACLRDYNYKPPAPWYPPPKAGLNVQGWLPGSRRTRNEPRPPPPLQRSISARHPAPGLSEPRRYKGTNGRPSHRHSNTHDGAFHHNYPTPPAVPRGFVPQSVIPRGPVAPRPTLRARTRAHNIPRAPSAQFRNMPLPPVHHQQALPPIPQHVRHHSTAGLLNRHAPLPPPPGQFSPGPSVVPSVRPRHHAPSRRGPRPRSNSFGGYRFPAPPRRY